MKNNKMNKLILLTILVLGLGACKKDSNSDASLLERPAPFTAVREIKNREKDEILQNIHDNLENLVSYKEEVNNHIYDYEPISTLKTEGIKETNIYTNGGYETTVDYTLTGKLGEYFTVENLKMIDSEKRFWKDGLSYQVNCTTEFIEPRYTFDKTKEEVPDIIPIILKDVPFDKIVDAPLYLTDKGDYRSVTERNRYNVQHVDDGIYEHEIEISSLYITISKDFKLVSSFTEEMDYVARFNNETRRPKEQFNLIKELVQGSRYKYGQKSDVPNIDKCISEFPAATFEKNPLATAQEYQRVLSGGSLKVDRGTVTDYETSHIPCILNEQGTLNGLIIFSGYTLNPEKATEIKLDFEVVTINEETGDKIKVSNILELDLENVLIDEDMSDIVKVINEDGYSYLVCDYPSPTVDDVVVNIIVDFTLTPDVDETQNPTAELKINSIEVLRTYIVIT